MLKRNSKIGNIIIDKEYYGKEPIIKGLILEILNSERNIPQFTFALIGKKSMAHHIAHKIAVKKREAKKIVLLEELIKEIKKTEVGKRLKNA